jgi:chromosome segregation protein
MKLEKIKLSGFKSFVDQVTIPIEGNLIAIVGPNGCGKSNIIDAIRWVMGESSAKHLRGASMADVVFNGSATRKPVSTASVELVFDNSEGKVGGEYAEYTKLAIKRQISRDGPSVYFLNGTRCRRKDITDLFLGTGLGARSYAIIEQGTISRIVEAKPDDLRGHIEEAAGISKYKERRHETETRMRHTHENLERLTDLRNEISQQLNHLQKQANKAEKYTTLKKQQRLYKLELLAMHWNQQHLLDKKLDEKLQQVACEHNRLFLLHREHEKAIGDKRCQQKQQQQQIDSTQKKFYQLNTETVKLQQIIENNERSLQETQLEIERLQESSKTALNKYQQECVLLDDFKQQLIQTQENLVLAEEVKEQTLEQQQKLEQQQSNWQQQWEHYRHNEGQQRQQIQLQQLKISQLTHQSQQLQSRLEKLHQERGQLSVTQLQLDINNLEQSIAFIEQQSDKLQQQLTTCQQQSAQHLQQLKNSQQILHKNQATLHTINGKITSLELLQQHAMEQDKAQLTAWLTENQLIEQPRLFEFLEVETGWEAALEIVLAQSLHAVCIDNINNIIPQLSSLNDHALALFENKPLLVNHPVLALPSLLEKINAPFDLAGLLTGIYCANNVDEARTLIEKLNPHESIITPEGTWLGRDWLTIAAKNSRNTGVLQREKQLRTLKQQQNHTQKEIHKRQQIVIDLDVTLKQLESKIENLRSQEKSLNSQASIEKSQISANQAKFEQQQYRLQHINTEIEELEFTLTDETEQLVEMEILMQEAVEVLKNLSTKKETLETEQQQLQQQNEQVTDAVMQANQQFHNFKSQLESLTVAKKAAEKHRESLQQQQNQSQLRINSLQAKRETALTPLDDERIKLEQLTIQKLALDAVLIEQRQQQQVTEVEINHLDKALSTTQQQMLMQKEALDKQRFEQQETQVRQQTFIEQLKELEADVETVLKNLTEGAELQQWKKLLGEVSAKIERLGSINLTAIDEFKSQSTRKSFLDEQHNDLTEALNVLLEAIEKIDKETRLRFKATFDRINTGLQEKFPKLFGGGQAYLELTEQNLLESGVNIIAKPPGKKNSSIHLLSGGEKALTAIALVFSIFELNPAPFCLLDEVDAPLDDANVGRFSKMVEQMSESVQFLFISHNKVTMEIAQQLTGVTMKEAGVSRMVAVNIENAVELAEG